jgi:hypothetical protein
MFFSSVSALSTQHSALSTQHFSFAALSPHDDVEPLSASCFQRPESSASSPFNVQITLRGERREYISTSLLRQLQDLSDSLEGESRLVKSGSLCGAILKRLKSMHSGVVDRLS